MEQIGLDWMPKRPPGPLVDDPSTQRDPKASDADKLVAQRLSAEFGRSFKAVRLAAGMTQEDVAKAIGPEFPYQTVSKIERAEMPNLTIATMERMARAVNCTLLIELHPNSGPPTARLTPRTASGS